MTIEQVREASRSIQENARQARSAFTEATQPAPAAAPPKKTPMQRAAEYAARPTVYQKLLDDD